MPQLIRIFCVVTVALLAAMPAALLAAKPVPRPPAQQATAPAARPAMKRAAVPAARPRAVEIIGETQSYTIQEDDVFADIARKYDLGYVALRAANPGIDAWIPVAGSEINLPLAHILPDAPRKGIVVNMSEERLYYYAPDGRIFTFPVGVVMEGMTMPHTPGRIIAKRKNPTWVPPPSVRKEHPDLPAKIPPGPDNPMGDYALYTSWDGIRIHGTNNPDGVGRRDSHGCLRMYPEDIEWLFNQIKIGTPVTVVDQPVKVGWQGNKLYLEVNPRMQDAEDVALKGRPRPLTGNDNFLNEGTALVLKAAKGQGPRVNWDLVAALIKARDGLPHLITVE